MTWSSCLERHGSQVFQVRVCASWGTVCLSVPEKQRHSLRQWHIQGSCVSLLSLEVSKAFRSLAGQLVLDINLVYLVRLANVIVSWQLQLYSSWQLPLYSGSDNGIRSLIACNKHSQLHSCWDPSWAWFSVPPTRRPLFDKFCHLQPVL